MLDREDERVVLPLPPGDAALGYAYPVAQYDHEEGRAIAGGFVYRGSAVPALVGQYVFGDIVNGRLFYAGADALADGSQALVHELFLTVDGEPRSLAEVVGRGRVDLRFGQDADGELYLLTTAQGIPVGRSGKVWKIVPR